MGFGKGWGTAEDRQTDVGDEEKGGRPRGGAERGGQTDGGNQGKGRAQRSTGGVGQTDGHAQRRGLRATVQET